MTDNEQPKNDDLKVSSEELESIEKQILDKDKAAEASLKKEIEDKVRKELETEQKLKELEAEKAKLEATVAKQAKEKEAIAQEKEKALEELKKEIGSTKAIVKPHNPFQKPVEPERNTDYGRDLSKEDIKDIDEESKKAFLKAMGITESQWMK